jgi:hypothetical protein
LLYYIRAIHAEPTIIQISISVKRNFGEAERAELGGRLRTRESPKEKAGAQRVSNTLNNMAARLRPW